MYFTATSVTQEHDNLNGIDWDLPGDTILLNESPVRITASTGEVGYGHLERSMRLDQAEPPLRPVMARW